MKIVDISHKSKEILNFYAMFVIHLQTFIVISFERIVPCLGKLVMTLY